MTSDITCKLAYYSGATKQSWLYGSEAKDNCQSFKGYYQYDSDHETLLALPCTRT